MTRFSLIALLLLTACSKEAAPPSGSPETGAPALATSAAVEADEVSAPDAKPMSRYTSFKDCKLVKSGEGEDWSISRCKGVAGYDLEIDYGDARDELVLKVPGKPSAAMGLFELGNGGFNALGDTAEWRGPAADEFEPQALIVRNNISEDPSNSSKQTSVLLVIDLRQGCVVGQVRPRVGQNEAARTIADGPQRPCLRR